MNVDINFLYGGAVLAGAASALVYAGRKRWTEAMLAAAAGISLATLLAAPASSGTGPQTLILATGSVAATLAPDGRLAAALAQLPSTSPGTEVEVQGHGLHEAQWRDMPVRPIRWADSKEDLLWLEFPRSLSLGRNFALTARRGVVQADWRLQLLAENGQVLSDSRAASPADSLTVQWQPPMAESMVLQARLTGKDGKIIAQGPVPLRVLDAVPLQVQGRFGAPSFDTRALNQLLTDSNAVVDWQTTLGKALTRSEDARVPLTHPNLLVADAAWLEHGGLRGALTQVAQGMPLLVLGGDPGDIALWQRELGLKLVPQSATTEQEDTRRLALAFPSGTQLPVAGGAWQAMARDRDGRPWLWQRDWQNGRIFWLGLRDWHRYAISEPAALGQWWQQVIDLVASGGEQKIRWIDAEPMPLVGLRTEVCAQGVAAGGSVTVGQEALRWQARGERADAVCVATWPHQAGWLPASSGNERSEIYVFGDQDWPAWQAALRHDATVRYASRARQPVASAGPPVADVAPVAIVPQAWATAVPRWLLGLAFTASMLLLWWRERR